jgi:5-methylcytosine-specific restriction endonuclease McrA
MLTNVPQNDPRYLTGDHLVAKHAGGKTVAGNIVAACRKCNNERHPELNKTREQRRLSSGEDVLRSPFEVLKGRRWKPPEGAG